MRLGMFNERISFHKMGAQSDGAGGTVFEEILILSTFAKVEQLKKSSDLEQAQQNLKGVFRVSIHDRNGFRIDESFTIHWRGNKYNIISTPEIDDVRNRRFLTFDISEVK